MAREIPHRYLQDNDGAEYFPVTSGQAIEELDKAASIVAINEKIAEINTVLNDVVGDTGWIDIDIPTSIKNQAITDGFKSAVREVRIGNTSTAKAIVFRSIRLNVKPLAGATMQVAQLPIGFVTNNQSFLARQHGYRHPIVVECKSDGTVTCFVHPDDDAKTDNWIYQEFTWLE